MTFNVNNLVSAINKTGVAKSSHFEVQVTGPGELGLEEGLLQRADTAELPGRSLMTAEYKFGNYGPMNKVPYGGATYSDTTITFILSEDMREKEYFEIWQDKIVNTGVFESTGGVKSRARSTFNPRYFDEYTGRLTIRQYGSQGTLHSIHTLHEAYPIQIAPISMNWAQDEVVRLSVTFAYRFYKAVFNKQDQPGLGRGFSIGIGPGGVSGSARIPGIGDIAGAVTGGLKTVQARVGDINSAVAQIRKSL